MRSPIGVVVKALEVLATTAIILGFSALTAYVVEARGTHYYESVIQDPRIGVRADTRSLHPQGVGYPTPVTRVDDYARPPVLSRAVIHLGRSRLGRGLASFAGERPLGGSTLQPAADDERAARSSTGHRVRGGNVPHESQEMRTHDRCDRGNAAATCVPGT